MKQRLRFFFNKALISESRSIDMEIKRLREIETKGYDIVKDDYYYEILVESYFIETGVKGGEIGYEK